MRYLAVMLVVLLSQAVSGQTLTKAQEGRVEISKCYSRCAVAAQAAGHWLRFEWEYAYHFDVNDRYSKFNLLSCIEFQEYGRLLDTCYTGCLDIEEAYGVKKSHARARFHRTLQNFRTPLQQAGLWLNYRDSPSYTGDDISAFVQACLRFANARSEETMQFRERRAYSDGSRPFKINGIPATEFSPAELNELLDPGE